MNDYSRISVAPMTGALGAEVRGVDLRNVDDAQLDEIQSAWLEFKVLFFRDQNLDHANHVRYGRRFGELEIHPTVNTVPEFPEIIVLETSEAKPQPREGWHSDVTFRERPPLGSILAGRIIPDYGGDTCFANMELVYDSLDDDTKAEIDGKTAIHSFAVTLGRDLSPELQAEALETYPEQKHPIVRRHPVTHRPSLFVNAVHTRTVDDMEPAEASRLLSHLYASTARPEFQCRFRWDDRSVAQWDNTCTQHIAVADYLGKFRRVERVTIAGCVPT